MIAPLLPGLLVTSVLLILGCRAPALADAAGDRQTVGNVTIYLGLLPAEMIRGHPKPSGEKCKA
jgi:hypothetical protein